MEGVSCLLPKPPISIAKTYNGESKCVLLHFICQSAQSFELEIPIWNMKYRSAYSCVIGKDFEHLCSNLVVKEMKLTHTSSRRSSGSNGSGETCFFLKAFLDEMAAGV